QRWIERPGANSQFQAARQYIPLRGTSTARRADTANECETAPGASAENRNLNADTPAAQASLEILRAHLRFPAGTAFRSSAQPRAKDKYARQRYFPRDHSERPSRSPTPRFSFPHGT